MARGVDGDRRVGETVSGEGRVSLADAISLISNILEVVPEPNQRTFGKANSC